MCGRYALSLRPSEVRQRLQDEDMPTDDCPDDDDHSIRQSYNFAPGNHGLVYRADVPDHGAGDPKDKDDDGKEQQSDEVDGSMTKETKYKLQGMKWGLIPFWTKRSPDYGSMMKTINARDDSLAAKGGMWNTMKQKKRCIVVCEGFYEWQKKNGGREKKPHFIKRKDGQLMCFAGLWDCVKYDGQDEKLYTYTIITTSSNKQLSWLHDRMPVILDPGSDALKTWLDPGRAEWSRELQLLLKPFAGELELYPVDQAVGKVGNNSPSFIVPVDSKENKKNIANFFGNQKKEAKSETEAQAAEATQAKVEETDGKIKMEQDEERVTDSKAQSTEDNAPMPVPKDEPKTEVAHGIKREARDDELEDDQPTPKAQKTNAIHDGPGNKDAKETPKPVSKTRSSTRNNTSGKSPSKAADGSKKITSFFGK